MPEINAAGSYQATQERSSSAQASSANQLGTDTFLQLLVTQLRYQDPFSGGGDMGDFISQMAQFTLLEQVVKLQKTFEDYVANESSFQAFSLLGKEVEIMTEAGAVLQGQVESVRIVNGRPFLKLGGQEYPLTSLLSVKANASGGAEGDE